MAVKKNAIICLQLFCFTLLYPQGNEYEQLKAELKKAKHDTIICSLLDQMIEIAPDGEWQKHNTQMQEVAVKNLKNKPQGRLLYVYSKYYATSLHNKGIIYSEQSNDDKAIEYFNKSIEMSKRSNNKLDMAISMQSLAQIEIRKGNITQALSQLYECLKIFEEEKDPIGIADVHLAIGDISFLQKDYRKALEHHLRSYDLYYHNHYDVAMSTISYKVGVDYFEMKDYSRSLDYLEKSISLYESSDYGANAVAYLNIAQIFIYQQKYDKALGYVKKGLETAIGIQNKLEECHAEILFSKIYLAQNNVKLSIDHAENALNIAQEIGHPAEVYMASKQLFELYVQTHNKQKAAEMKVILSDAKNIIDNQESKNALLEQKLKYEYEKKEIITKAENEKQLTLLKTETERQKLKKNIWLIAFGALLILILVSAYFLYKNFKQKSIIANQKSNLLKQKLLVSQMNPHFIFNSLNAIQNYIFKQDSFKAGTYLTQFSELIRMILDYSRKDFISIDDELKFLNNYLELQKLRFENKLEYTIDVASNIETEFVLIPPMLAQPFIENAIEHGIFHKETNGKIEIRLFFENGKLIYEIEDNGIGIEEAMKLKSKLKSSYESLATVITKERINSMNQEQKHLFAIDIIDKKNLQAESTGVKVKLVIPFKGA